MAKRVYLVRHGETENNSKKLIQSPDSILSTKGVIQSMKLAERLKNISFDRVIVSDYVRTKETIAPLLPNISVIPEYSELVREVRSPAQFYDTANRSEDFLSYLRQADENICDENWHYADEENFYDILKRVNKLFSVIDERGDDILIVTHSQFILYVIMYVITNGQLNVDTWLKSRYGFEATNTGVTVLRFNEEYDIWKVLTFNDHAHFAE